MLIRSVDFARHSVVLASETELASTPGQNQAPRGELVARVLNVVGAEATLQIGNQRVVVQTHVPLNAGDKLNVRLSEGEAAPDGTPTLKLVIVEPESRSPSSPVLLESDLDALLRDVGVSADARSRLLARALIARDGALERPALLKLLADLRPFPEVTAREAGAAALLQKARVAITPEAVSLVTARAEPEAPPQLASRLLALMPALEQLKAQLPARSSLSAPLQEVMRLLSGLPLDEGADAPAVTQALREWVGRLQPEGAAGRPAAQGASLPPAVLRLPQALSGASAPTAGPAPTVASPSGRGVPTAPAQAAIAPAQAATAPARAASVPAQASAPTTVAPAEQGATASEQAPPSSVARPGAQPASPAPTAGRPAGLLQPSLERLASEASATLGLPTGGKSAPSEAQAASDAAASPAEQSAAKVVPPAGTTGPEGRTAHAAAPHAPRVGITTISSLPDLAALLERLDGALGSAEPQLKAMLKEAVAEVRYTQVLNGPSPQPQTSGQEYLVPLLLPSLNPDHPEGKLQVYQKPGQSGASADPRAMRLVFILETAHLGRVQADVNIQDGQVDLVMGLPTTADNALVGKHLGELEAAIAKLGFTPGRFASRVARKQPPKLPQEEGLTEVKRFDRRV